jgi:uridine kinase
MNNELISSIANSKHRVIAVTGNAGAGKTFFSEKAKSAISNLGIYSFDWRFIGDSEERLNLLNKKSRFNMTAYLDAINQFSWWNWDSIQQDILFWKSNKQLSIKDYYDRNTGKICDKELSCNKTSRLLLEGAILGPPAILRHIEKIYFIYVPPDIRFKRIIEKDKGRRSAKEICIRFLITEYSENLHYQNLFRWYKHKIICVDSEWNVIPFINTSQIVNKENYVPMRISI